MTDCSLRFLGEPEELSQWLKPYQEWTVENDEDMQRRQRRVIQILGRVPNVERQQRQPVAVEQELLVMVFLVVLAVFLAWI